MCSASLRSGRVYSTVLSRVVSTCLILRHVSTPLLRTVLYAGSYAPRSPTLSTQRVPSGLRELGWWPPGHCSPRYARSGDSPRSPVEDREVEQAPLILSYSTAWRWLLYGREQVPSTELRSVFAQHLILRCFAH